jgi:hypothetical protein
LRSRSSSSTNSIGIRLSLQIIHETGIKNIIKKLTRRIAEAKAEILGKAREEEREEERDPDIG